MRVEYDSAKDAQDFYAEWLQHKDGNTLYWRVEDSGTSLSIPVTRIQMVDAKTLIVSLDYSRAR